MKISQMNTDQMADALCMMAEPLEIIGNDPDFGAAFAKLDGMKGSLLEKFAAGYGKIVPIMLRKHRNETYTILAAMTGKTPEEIAKQNVLRTMQDVRDSVDQELLDFFGLSAAADGEK